jgi:hypothetical protein
VKRAFELNVAKKHNSGDIQEQLRAMGGMNNAADALELQDDLPEPGPPPGAIEEGVNHPYQWTQDGEDLVVTVPNLPAETGKGDVRCDIKMKHIHLECGKAPDGERVIIDGALELCSDVIPDESSWSILTNKDGTKRIEVTMTKGKDMRWPCLTLTKSAPEMK